jgi:adenylate cyclase
LFLTTGSRPALLFADVAGSTKLYDSLGDVVAKKLVDECMDIMSASARQYGGRVIKTIGDEVMCLLPSANNGCMAASDMQMKIGALPSVSGIKRAIRVGFHAGPVIEQADGDVFGDTVNIAARMAGIAKGNQIITTRSTVMELSGLLQNSVRDIAALSVKGKADDIEICEVLWQATEDLTTLATATSAPMSNTVATSRSVLRVRYGAEEFILEQAGNGLSLGRDEACHVVITDRMASRQHAKIECRRDKFFLSDQSTNGTFVMVDGEPEMVLRREEFILRGSGTIAFGRAVSESLEGTLRYELSVRAG